MSLPERIFCIYCKQTIEVLLNDVQICPNCLEILKAPHAELFNGVFILKTEVKALIELENKLEEKILFKGLHEILTNEFEVDESHAVTSLKLNFNNLTELPNLFNNLHHLKELKLTSRSLAKLPEDFHPPTLKDLSFFSCKFSVIPKAVFNCRSLVNLWISGTNIKIIPEEIKELVNLEVIKLNNNKINAIHENIRLLTKLTMLDVGCNQLKEIPMAFFELPNLSILKMHVNYLEEIPKEVIHLEKLQILELYCNFLTRIPPLPADLQYLDVSSNFNLELTDNLEEFSNLTLLNIGGNTKIDVEALKKIVKEESLITKLNLIESASYTNYLPR